MALRRKDCQTESFSFPFFALVFTPDSVGVVLRRTRPNAICIPNRTGLLKKHAKPDNFLKLNGSGVPSEPFNCRESLLWEGFVTPILADSSAHLFPIMRSENRKLNASDCQHLHYLSKRRICYAPYHSILLKSPQNCLVPVSPIELYIPEKCQYSMTQFLQDTHKFCVLPYKFCAFGVESGLKINFHPPNETHFFYKGEP